MQKQAKVCEYLKYGTFFVSGRPKLGHRTHLLKYGMSREIRDSWQP